MLVAQSVWERYIFFHMGDLLRLCAMWLRARRTIEPLTPSTFFFRGVIDDIGIEIDTGVVSLLYARREPRL